MGRTVDTNNVDISTDERVNNSNFQLHTTIRIRGTNPQQKLKIFTDHGCDPDVAIEMSLKVRGSSFSNIATIIIHSLRGYS